MGLFGIGFNSIKGRLPARLCFMTRLMSWCEVSRCFQTHSSLTSNPVSWEFSLNWEFNSSPVCGDPRDGGWCCKSQRWGSARSLAVTKLDTNPHLTEWWKTSQGEKPTYFISWRCPTDFCAYVLHVLCAGTHTSTRAQIASWQLASWLKILLFGCLK